MNAHLDRSSITASVALRTREDNWQSRSSHRRTYVLIIYTTASDLEGVTISSGRDSRWKSETPPGTRRVQLENHITSLLGAFSCAWRGFLTQWVTVHKPKEKLIASLTVIAVTKKETCHDPGKFRRTPTTVWGEARLTKVAASFRGQGGLFGGSLLAPRVAPLCSTHRDSSGSL